jgi:hypothetical protein
MQTRAERATYTALFGSGEFRAVFLANVVSMLGTVVADVALTVLVFARTGSPALSALTFTMGFLPYLFGGALLGGLVDRWPIRRTMVTCDMASACVFVVMALPGVPVAGLLALAFAGGLIAPVFGGTRAALLPQLLGSGSTYVLGRAAMRMVSQGSQVIGFAVGGLLVAVVGSRTALLLDAGSFLLSSLVVRWGIGPYEPVAVASSQSLVGDSLRGLRAVFAHAPTRRLLLFRWLLPACCVAPEALAAAYVHALHGPQRAVGFYLAAMPAAVVLSDLVVARFLGSRISSRLMVFGSLLTVGPMLGFLAMPSLGFALALLFAMGLGAWQGLALDLTLLDTVPKALQSRALGVDQAGLMFLQGLGFGVWGVVGQVLSLRLAIGLAGASGVTVVLVWMHYSRRDSRREKAGMPPSAHALDVARA